MESGGHCERSSQIIKHLNLDCSILRVHLDAIRKLAEQAKRSIDTLLIVSFGKYIKHSSFSRQDP
jgi:hypothetical protein